jgi:putative adhesin
MFMVAPARQRLAALALILLGTAPLLHAQRRSFRDWELSCSHYSGDRDGERVCNIIEKTIPLAGGTLNVDGRTNGGVTVIGENRRDILVRALVDAHARSESRAEEIADGVRLHTEDGRIFAEGPETRNREWWSVSLEVHVPARTDLELRAHNGGIAVAGVTGTLRMETLNGGIHLEAVNGDVVAETTNGGLHVALDGDRWEGKGLDATTTNGGVRLSVPSGYSAHLETGTVNGGVDIDFPVTVQGKIGRRITTDLGRGGPTIRVITTNGGVTIKRN